MYDAIVVGARCAGAPTAMLLARAGHRVLLVDRATFPSDTMSSHFIHASGIARLERWGLLERLRATDTPPQERMTFDFGPFALTGRPTPADGGISAGYGPRRWLIDQILVDAAMEAGAELREATTIRELIFDGGRVVGVRGMTRNGEAVEVRAPLVIGADGKRSVVARAVGAPRYRESPAASCNYYAYWRGFAADHIHLFARDQRFFIALPTNAGLTCLVALWPIGEFDRVRADPEGEHVRALSSVPWIAERLAVAEQVERVVGTADLDGFFRTPYGPGWALVGDAGHHKDPITAQGMADAFRDAEFLADAVDAGLSGRQPLDEALAEYELRRNRAALPMYEMTCGLAALEPPPPAMQALFGALVGNQQEIDRFLGAMAGTVPLEAFFAPENIARIVAAFPAN